MHQRSAVVLAGGSHGHDFAATASALADVLHTHGYSVDVIDQPDDVWHRMIERAEPYDLLAVNGLRFRMSHPRYESMRTTWEYHTPAAADSALDRHLAAGGSVFAVHTGIICFDDWDRWGKLLGRRWSWDENQLSWHPERGLLTIEPTDNTLVSFELVDEVYTDMVATDAIDVRATCAGQPVMWTRCEGMNRIAVTTVGHGVDTYENSSYAALLHPLVEWLASSTSVN